MAAVLFTAPRHLTTAHSSHRVGTRHTSNDLHHSKCARFPGQRVNHCRQRSLQIPQAVEREDSSSAQPSGEASTPGSTAETESASGSSDRQSNGNSSGSSNSSSTSSGGVMGPLLASAAVGLGAALFVFGRMTMGPSLEGIEAGAIPLSQALSNGRPTVLECVRSSFAEHCIVLSACILLALGTLEI